MSAPALSGDILAEFTVKRSGPSVTVMCWKPTCSQRIVFRGRSIGLLALLRDVERHWQTDHAEQVRVDIGGWISGPGISEPT